MVFLIYIFIEINYCYNEYVIIYFYYNNFEEICLGNAPSCEHIFRPGDTIFCTNETNNYCEFKVKSCFVSQYIFKY